MPDVVSPKAISDPMITKVIKAMIKPYSIAVAPDSS